MTINENILLYYIPELKRQKYMLTRLANLKNYLFSFYNLLLNWFRCV